jgi:hypothetical protein
MIVVTVNAGALFEGVERRSKDDNSVIELVCLNTEFAYEPERI